MENHLFKKGKVTHRFRSHSKEDALKCLQRCIPKTWHLWEYAGTDNNSTSYNFVKKTTSTKSMTQLPSFRVGKFTKHGSF